MFPNPNTGFFSLIWYLLKQMNPNIDNWPPTQDALPLHVCKAMLQSKSWSEIWSFCTTLEELTIDLQN